MEILFATTKKHKKAIKKIAEVLARSEKNVMIAFSEKRCEL